MTISHKNVLVLSKTQRSVHYFVRQRKVLILEKLTRDVCLERNQRLSQIQINSYLLW